MRFEPLSIWKVMNFHFAFETVNEVYFCFFMRSAIVQSRTPVASHSCIVRQKARHYLHHFAFPLFLFGPIGFDCLHTTLSKKQKTNRQIFIGAVNVVGYGGSLIILSNTWYKNYPHTSFHTFNDAGEWLQVDKFGHGWTAYNTGRVSAAMWRWAGLSQKQSAIIGGLSGAVYLTVIEFLDAHSAQWGWSWGDMTANIVGSGLFISQELLWKEQRIQYKFSFHHKDYGDSALNKRADDLIWRKLV